MPENNFYLRYLNKLGYQYSNTYHPFINRKPIDIYYSDLTEKNESSQKSLKLMIVSELLSMLIFLVMFALKTGPEKQLSPDLWLKLILGCIELTI